VKKNGLKTTGSFDKEIRSSTERNLKIELEDDVVDFLSEVGYNEKYWARNLQRVVEEYCLNKIYSFLANNIHIKDKAFHFQMVNNTLTLGIHDITPIVSSN
jgi:ATP-dependent Clp protease ATP-binding subunit ClpA